MIIAVPKEITSGEKRVALVPESIQRLPRTEVMVEKDAGQMAGYVNDDYIGAAARVIEDARTLYQNADVVLKVNPPTFSELANMKAGTTLVSFLYPAVNLELVKNMASANINAFAMDMIPRISRAQSMDALSSQSNISGYKAALLAADMSPKIFPMMMTAAGTIPPARVFVIGAGVAGLQAIATARRLGAVVEAYDVRPAVKEQVESLGAKFVELQIETKEAETESGYAKAQSAEFYTMQQKLLAEHAKSSDVIITTALVVGRKAPVLLTEEAVRGMKYGSVIVDIAAEQGGNCELTEPGNVVTKYGVTIVGLLNLPSMMPREASQMYSRNIVAFLSTVLKDGVLQFDRSDPVVASALITHNGQIVHQPTKAQVEKPN